jgi:shikimate kinase
MAESTKPAQSSGPASTIRFSPSTASPLPQPVIRKIVQRIVLTGFMGAGKTTVGRLLARDLAWKFIDADSEIEAATGTTIARLFEERGEPWFRQFEHEIIRQLLTSPSVVLALGGGAIEDHRTRKLLLSSEGTHLVHLEATLDTVLLRCQGTEWVRPILQDQINLADRYERRLPLYRESHHTVIVDSLSPNAVVAAILQSIRS